MKCRKCRSEIEKNSDFCPNCGAKTNRTLKIAITIIAVIVLGIIIFVAGIYVLVFSILGEVEKHDYIELDDYKVPNIIYNSDYKVCRYASSGNKKTIEPCKNFSDEFLDEFVEDMKKSGYEYIETDDGRYLNKQTEEGYTIEIKFSKKEVIYLLK